MLSARTAGYLAGLLLLGASLALAFRGSSYSVQVLMWICTASLMAASLRFVLLIGEVNLGTAAFYGIGAYSSAITATELGLPTLASLVAGMITATLVSVPFGVL